MIGVRGLVPLVSGAESSLDTSRNIQNESTQIQTWSCLSKHT
jgi:hypothetical protein